MRPVDGDGFFEQVYERVAAIPPGRVSSYGRLARELTGRPGAARTVGWALRALSCERARSVPWWRVVDARGRIRTSAASDGGGEQRARLEAEGVPVGSDGRVDLSRYGWP